MTLLSARNLRLSRNGNHMLNGVSLELKAGETLALLGPNGAGKSSLLMCLANLWEATGGEILIEGTKIGGIDYRRSVAFVFQEPLLLDDTVESNVATGLKLRGLNKSEIEPAVAESLERFKIGHLAKREAKLLSGGEAQRVSLARAFALKPRIIFMDEPLASLDQPGKESILEDLARNFRQCGISAIIATHDRLEALRLADRIAIMKDGSIVQQGEPLEVINRPASEFIAEFVGMETILTGRVIAEEVGGFVADVGGRKVIACGSAETGQTVLMGIRPENVTLLRHSTPDATSARNRFECVVERIQPHPPFFKVNLDCGFALAAYVTQRSLEDLSIFEGASIYAEVKATSIHLISHD